MIGANGAGKTSFLDVMSIIGASANGKLNDTLQTKGGLNEILTRGKAKGLEISLSVKDLEEDEEPFTYSLSISPKGLSYEINREKLSRNSRSFYDNIISREYIDSYLLAIKYFQEDSDVAIQPNWEHNPLETSLSQVPKMYQKSEALRKSLASCTYYGALDVSEKSPVRLPQAMRPAKLPGAKGEDLVSCLYDLRESDRDRFEMVESIISRAFPDFVRLSFLPVAAGTISMTWTDRNFSQPIYIHELSEGTLRFLWLVALLQSQNLSTITLLDEPEVSLHPELLRHLAYLMREASKHTQLIVATHSDRLVRFLEPNEVLICDLEDGEATMTWADSLNLDQWLKDYTMDQLWAMNVVGGCP
ncbi:MAG: AAA family ATPase [Pseudanabaena sp. CAN_BIN31]|nr:AAA family ATPase [Pseudanabaena sp. CAN_BIN31]